MEIFTDIAAGILWIAIFYIIIALVWQMVEYKFYGKVSPRTIDDVIALILAVSLYFNFR